MSKVEGKLIAIKFTEPLNDVTLVPTVVIDDSYKSPKGVVTYSNQYTSYNPATAVFDNNTSLYWQTRATLPQWVMIELPEAKMVVGFRVYSDGANYCVNGIDLYGSNDGVNFDLIIQTTNAKANGWKTYPLNLTPPYKYYKWVVNSTHTAGRVYVHELQLLFAQIINLSGNEDAFAVTGQEHLYTDGPDNNGNLINKTYPISLVQTHPTEPKTIQLIMADSFRNVQGSITISYNQALGNLAGRGGAVTSFEETFTPQDLVEGLTDRRGAFGTHEHIDASIGGTVELKYITKLQGYSAPEYIEASIGGSVQLIHINDINP
jgi:hypothetical protein